MKVAFSLLVAFAMTATLPPAGGAQPPVVRPQVELAAPVFPLPVDAGFADFAFPRPIIPAVAPTAALNFSNLIAAKIE